MTRRKQEGPLEGGLPACASLLHFYSGQPLQYRSGVDKRVLIDTAGKNPQLLMKVKLLFCARVEESRVDHKSAAYPFATDVAWLGRKLGGIVRQSIVRVTF